MSSIDLDSENTLGTISSTFGLGTTAFAAGCSEATIDNYSGTGFVEIGEETSAGTDSAMDAADGNPLPLTTVGGLLSLFSGSSSGYGDELTIIIFRQDNNKVYSSVERKAKEIYDNYDNNHIQSKTEGVSLITENKEVATVVNDIIKNAKSKHELLAGLEAIEQVIKDKSTAPKSPQKIKKRKSINEV